MPLCPGLSGWAGTKREPTHTWNVLWESVIILDFMRRGEDNRGKCTDNLVGCHLIRPSMSPPPSSTQFYAECPSYHNPPFFILAWDRHQICWIAYLEAWFKAVHQLTCETTTQEMLLQILTQVVMPREENLAIWLSKLIPPTPMTSIWSAGLFNVLSI